MIRVLLSLLLLVSQQMAFAHVITHWSGQRSAALEQKQGGDGSVSEAFAKDQACAQCLAFAQIASAVGDSPRSFAPPGPVSSRVGLTDFCAVQARTICAFRSRAPPTAV
jgi:hypothetical protein